MLTCSSEVHSASLTRWALARVETGGTWDTLRQTPFTPPGAPSRSLNKVHRFVIGTRTHVGFSPPHYGSPTFTRRVHSEWFCRCSAYVGVLLLFCLRALRKIRPYARYSRKAVTRKPVSRQMQGCFPPPGPTLVRRMLSAS